MMPSEATTVADDLVVVHIGEQVYRRDGLAPDSVVEVEGVRARTLTRPHGELLSRLATVNDVHLGETECGRIDDHEIGPILRSEPGDPPYPLMMSAGAVAEIAAIDPMFVVAKGDLTGDGADAEFEAFEQCYGSVFGERLLAVRGNHDAYHGQTRYAGDRWITMPGLSVALLDTALPGQTPGTITASQFEWLEDQLATAPGRVLIMGHHEPTLVADDAPTPEADQSRGDHFGLDPAASTRLDALCARWSNVIGYTCGHTHRHRVRAMPRSGATAVEVGCTKDFPGTWAEYRVYEGGVMQVVHRISSPSALAWSERCRHLYSDFGVDYETYALGSLTDRCFVFADRE